jgi:hypothetical protein
MDLTCAKCAKNYRRVENIRACGFSSRHLEDAAVVSASPSPLLHFSGDPGEVPDLIYDSRIHHFARVVRPIFLPPSPRFLAIARFETTTLSLSLSLSQFVLARRKFWAARHDVGAQIESPRWKTRRNSISISCFVVGNATPHSFGTRDPLANERGGFPSIAAN